VELGYPTKDKATDVYKLDDKVLEIARVMKVPRCVIENARFDLHKYDKTLIRVSLWCFEWEVAAVRFAGCNLGYMHGLKLTPELIDDRLLDLTGIPEGKPFIALYERR